MYSIARPGLCDVLSKILIASSSYPIISISHSISSQQCPNDVFIINLKMKLYLELFYPCNCPPCLCSKSINPFGMHTFCCTRVSKKIIHDRIWDNTAEALDQIIRSAGLLGKGSLMIFESK